MIGFCAALQYTLLYVMRGSMHLQFPLEELLLAKKPDIDKIRECLEGLKEEKLHRWTAARLCHMSCSHMLTAARLCHMSYHLTSHEHKSRVTKRDPNHAWVKDKYTLGARCPLCACTLATCCCAQLGRCRRTLVALRGSLGTFPPPSLDTRACVCAC
eukprot:1006209-Amphidinium_carterae.1